MKFVKKVTHETAFGIDRSVAFFSKFATLKVYDDYSLKNLFAEHVAKFNSKHDQELVFLDDVR